MDPISENEMKWNEAGEFVSNMVEWFRKNYYIKTIVSPIGHSGKEITTTIKKFKEPQ
jgi:hypothetical protein